MFTNPTPDTPPPVNTNGHRRKIHFNGVSWAFRHACITALARGTKPLRHNGHSHVDLLNRPHPPKRFRFTGGNAGEIIAQITGGFFGNNDGGFIFFQQTDAPIWADINTFSTVCTGFKKLGFRQSTGRSQPIGSFFLRLLFFFLGCVPMFEVLLDRDAYGNHAMF